MTVMAQTTAWVMPCISLHLVQLRLGMAFDLVVQGCTTLHADKDLGCAHHLAGHWFSKAC